MVKRLLIGFAVLAIILAVTVPAMAAGGKGHDRIGPNVIGYDIVHFPAKGGKPGRPGGGGDDPPSTPPELRYVLLPGGWGTKGAPSTVTYVVEDPGIAGAVDTVVAASTSGTPLRASTSCFGGTQDVNVNAEFSAPNTLHTVFLGPANRVLEQRPGGDQDLDRRNRHPQRRLRPGRAHHRQRYGL